MKTKLPKISKREKEALEQAYKKAQNVREKVRFQAMVLASKGYGKESIADITGCKISTLREWITKYNKLGIDSLRNKQLETSNRSKLSIEERREIGKVLATKKPLDVGLKEEFWNVKLLKRYIREKYGIEYKTPEAYRRIFHKNGYSFHKPNKVNIKRDSHMVKRFEDKLKKSSESMETKIVWYW